MNQPCGHADSFLRAGASVPAAFAAVVAKSGSRRALVCGSRSWTYAELDRRSDAIARRLIARGLQPGSIVGLSMGRSPETIAAILGVLKAGAAYLPFDPAYPAAQLKFILEDSAPALVLTQRAATGGLDAAAFANIATLDIEAAAAEVAGLAPALPELRPDDRAYIMYTSGSTGRPKGVQVPQRAILRLVIDNDFCDFGPDQVILQLAPLAFDASTFELWAALLHGGCLAIVPAAQPALAEIAETIAAHAVTTAWLTAGLFHLMVDHQLEGLRPLRQLLAGGDVLSVAHVDRLLAAHASLRLINGYGPTENTTFSCCYTIPRQRAPGPIPIGRAIRHSPALVLDGALRPVADGTLGELFVGGAGLALGYLNRPELDAERFIAHPFDAAPGARLYRTGDLVRRRADGNLEFHGRADRQVKINGKRVELDEIEAVLRRGPGVGDAAVTLIAAAGDRRRIAAYATAAAGQRLVVEHLREFLRAELPDYMQPSSISLLDRFPLSPTGKVDRARLPLADLDRPQAAAVPKNEIEAKLLAIWRDVLGTQAVGIDDNFFDVGGSSLQMLKVHAAICAALPKKPTLLDLFTYPKLRTLAAWLMQPEPPSGRDAASDARERGRRLGAALARAKPVTTAGTSDKAGQGL
ncbi:MAG: hypothetical protein NVS9B10_30020 [Nevskia sp.]